MVRLRKYTTALGIGLLLCWLVATYWQAAAVSYVRTDRLMEMQQTAIFGRADSSRFPVRPFGAQDYRYLYKNYPLDLKTPSNLKTEFVYDPTTGYYLLTTTLDGKVIGVPIPYTVAEYIRYIQRTGMYGYFLAKDRENAATQGKKTFNPLDMTFELGPAEKIFGPGGVKVRTQGSAEVLFGIKSNATNNPSLPEQSRRHTFLDFNEKIQLNVQASVGTKLNFNMNYNTESTFDIDAKKLKLAYEGEEDDIIKLIEAGNVSMTSRNSLIQGGASLFGLRSRMQFGKLDVDVVVSQQEAETKRVSAQSGAQTSPFEFSADNYDENRHFYLGHYFIDQYDEAMRTLPFVSSGVKINRMEVWVTNRRNAFDDARNIVAFADLGEPKTVANPNIIPNGSTGGLPANAANSLYSQLLGMSDARRIDRVTQVIGALYQGGSDYEKVESARKLNPSEYTFNANLGYISLSGRLNADEVLGVAFEYTYQGRVYQVGEFSTDRPDNSTDNLFVKLLKGSNMSPISPYWDYMMKNVYVLGPGVYNLQPDKFRLDVYYQSDADGTQIPYINEGRIKGQLLLRALGADRLDKRNEPHPDGTFDYVEGYTVNSQRGYVIFPSVQPFGKTLAKALGDEALAKKYAYFELYDTTAVAARQVAERNKFVIRGEYRASSGGEISLGATNVTPGSVKVTAGGAQLVENVDYTVDYISGTVRIINGGILASGNRVDVSLENRGMFNLQRKTMLGLDLNYRFTKDFSLGATVMHLSEMPLTTKTAIGSESLKNTLWGLNLSYRTQSQWLTNILDALPLLSLTKPSEISLNAEFAHLIPGHYESKYARGNSYLDDFEMSQSSIDMMNPYSWMLSSTPFQDGPNPLFPEAKLVNDVAYGNRRALLAWYHIDPLFTRERNSLTPSYLKNDLEQLSNHFVREINVSELFPYRDMGNLQQTYINTFNLAYYPSERGPYNVNAETMASDGRLTNPEKNWGGMMRKIDQSDFEASNIEYVEFWVMDPFVYDPSARGGDLYINLGEVSEEVLKDERKFFENGMPINDDPQAIETTIWGKVPKRQGSGYAFDNTPGARAKQDVGFNGLTTEEEKLFPTYADYVRRITTKADAATLQKWGQEPFSPINDPAGDNFRHYRSADFDALKTPILDRYKQYNGVEGNSAEAGAGVDNYSVASRVVPDVEDINQDNTLNETEKYFEYKISLRPQDLVVGKNNVVDKRVAVVTLRNGKQGQVAWYQFKVPIRKYNNRIGGITDFKTIRFMRLFLTDFSQEVMLRFGTFKLVRGDWRIYGRELHDPAISPSSNGTIEVSAVSIEENGDRKPVNYVLPPGVLRSLDAQQAQSTQQNEQSMSLRIRRLAPGDARAVYKNTQYDLRRYRRLQLFTHAERLPDDDTGTSTGELYAFIRLGSDYKNNYYEYTIPLHITPEGIYNPNNEEDKRRVWPDVNFINLSLENLTNLKTKRNLEHNRGNAAADYYRVFSLVDPDNSRATISVIGNPSLSNVKTIMIGVRNSASTIKSGEIWVNELRLTDYQEDGGWAANANVNIQLSDLGSFNARGQYVTAGFGALDQTLAQRRLEDSRLFNMSMNLELGKLFPAKAQVSIPLYYSVNDEMITPQYNPLDQDILLKNALKATDSKVQRDSIRNLSVTQTTQSSLSLTNMRANIRSKNPMPYDPANFSFSYAHNSTSKHTPEIEYDRQTNWVASITYDYSPLIRPIKPFGFIKDKKPATAYFRQLGINPLPSKISLRTNMTRNYQEQQVRSISPGMSEAFKLPANFMQNFFWERTLAINWDLTNNLRLNFRSGTNARIEEPYVQVNRTLAPDKYKVWRDSVMQSIAELGKPWKYDQEARITFVLPTSAIPILNWINGSANYTATYNWDRGANTRPGETIGNIVRNQLSLDGRVQLNLLNLYRKINYLKDVEGRVTNPDRPVTPPKPLQPHKQQVQLKADSSVVISHPFKTRSVQVSATLGDKPYQLRTRIVGKDKIEILSRDSVSVAITIIPPKPSIPDPTTQYTTDRLVYTLMSVRSVDISYRRTRGLNLPGFLPGIQAMGGQGKTPGGLAPGLDFAFGFIGDDYVDRAAERGWLIQSEQNVNPAIFSESSTFETKMVIEPIRDLRITLNANRTDTRQTETQYMFAGRPRTYGGNFVMTTIGLKGFFATPDGSNGYASDAFSNFLAYRTEIAGRIRDGYQGGSYPAAGILVGDPRVGQPIQLNDVNVRANSPEVLIPAFLSAYTTSGKVSSISLSPFPALSALLPNWNINYSGLGKIPALKKLFTNFIIKHSYNAKYQVDSYTSYLGYAGIEGRKFGFVAMQTDATTGSTTPELVASAPYNIPGVSIQESFYPLIGIDVAFVGGLGIGTEWRKQRTLKLNLSAFQLIESATNELSLSISYKIANFAQLIGLRTQRPNRRNTPAKPPRTGGAMTIRAEYSFNRSFSLIRRIQENFTQATAGNQAQNIKLSADYELSRLLTMRAFFDWDMNRPLVSAASFPVSNTNFGASLRFNLTQ